jgi:hypothetical protein
MDPHKFQRITKLVPTTLKKLHTSILWLITLPPHKKVLKLSE